MFGQSYSDPAVRNSVDKSLATNASTGNILNSTNRLLKSGPYADTSYQPTTMGATEVNLPAVRRGVANAKPITVESQTFNAFGDPSETGSTGTRVNAFGDPSETGSTGAMPVTPVDTSSLDGIITASGNPDLLDPRNLDGAGGYGTS